MPQSCLPCQGASAALPCCAAADLHVLQPPCHASSLCIVPELSADRLCPGYEHVEALGGTIESIAAAKAGIIKPGRPVVVARQQYPPALQVLEREAVRQDAALLHAGQHVSVKHEGYAIAGHPSSQVLREQVRLSFPADQASAAGAGHTPLQPPQAPLSLSTCLVGAHQHDNLAAATATCLVLRQQGWPISDGALASGLAAARLPGRMQVLHLPASSGVSSSQDVSSTSDAGHQLLVLDGAHSPESATALAQVLRSAFPIQPIVLVVAMASDKDTRGVLGALRACHPSAVVFTTVPIAGSQHRSAAPGGGVGGWVRSRGGAACARLCGGKPVTGGWDS
jgi:folylpolyglutamate synthase/dihydropteroate synthase